GRLRAAMIPGLGASQFSPALAGSPLAPRQPELARSCRIIGLTKPRCRNEHSRLYDSSNNIDPFCSGSGPNFPRAGSHGCPPPPPDWLTSLTAHESLEPDSCNKS